MLITQQLHHQVLVSFFKKKKKKLVIDSFSGLLMLRVYLPVLQQYQHFIHEESFSPPREYMHRYGVFCVMKDMFLSFRYRSLWIWWITLCKHNRKSCFYSVWFFCRICSWNIYCPNLHVFGLSARICSHFYLYLCAIFVFIFIVGLRDPLLALRHLLVELLSILLPRTVFLLLAFRTYLLSFSLSFGLSLPFGSFLGSFWFTVWFRERRRLDR